MPSDLKTQFLFEVKIPLAPPMQLGDTPEGNRMIVMAASGSFEGPRMKGEVIPMSGGDWARVRKDGSGALDVRLTLKTDDGALILMTYQGRMIAAPEHFNYALDFAKPDDRAGAETRYYFRTNPLFETGDERYHWMNGIITIGKGRTGDGGVIYEVFEVK